MKRLVSFVLPGVILVLQLLAGKTFAEEGGGLRLTLDDCLEMGLQRASSLLNARRDTEIARAQIRSIRAAIYPQLTLNASYTRLDDMPEFRPELGFTASKNNYSASFDAEQLLYGGGAVNAALRIAGFFEEAAVMEALRVESDLVRRITTSFYEILYLQEAVKVAEEFIEQLQSIEQQAERRYRAETGSEIEWLNARVALANERPTLISARNARSLSQRAFRDLIRIEEENFRLEGELHVVPTDVDREELVAHAMERRPELLALRARLETLRNQEDVTRSRYKPEVNAFGSYAGVEPSQRDPFQQDWQWEWVVGIRATWSLFDGGRRGADLRTDRLETAKLEETLEEFVRATRLEVDQLWLLLEEKRETLRGTEENIRLAERAQRIASVRFEQGLATYVDFSESTLALNAARLNHFEALLGYRRAYADLEHVAGMYEPAEGASRP